MTKNIFKATEIIFVRELLNSRKGDFFPDCKGKKIEKIEIQRVSPEWAKDTCLVRYKVVFKNGVEKIIRGTAKVKSSKKDVYNLMHYLYSDSKRPEKLSVPRPLVYLSKINMLFYEEAPGKPLVLILQKEDLKEKIEALKGVADWLFWLHGLTPRKKKLPSALFRPSSGYKEILFKIKENIPEIKNDLISEKDVEFVDKIWRLEGKVIHNDFYPGNSVINDKVVFGIDFDKAGYGPIFMDIAAMVSFFDFSKNMWPHKMNEKDSQELQAIFVERYCLNNGIDPKDMEKKIRPFVVKSFLDQLHYYSAFFIRGREYMDDEEKKKFLTIINDVISIIRKALKAL